MRITIDLTNEIANELRQMAQEECRSARDQAVWIITSRMRARTKNRGRELAREERHQSDSYKRPKTYRPEAPKSEPATGPRWIPCEDCGTHYINFHGHHCLATLEDVAAVFDAMMEAHEGIIH